VIDEDCGAPKKQAMAHVKLPPISQTNTSIEQQPSSVDAAGLPSHSFVFDSVLPTLLAYCENFSKWRKSRDLNAVTSAAYHRSFWPSIANLMPKLDQQASSPSEKTLVLRISHKVTDLFRSKSIFGLMTDEKVDGDKEDARSVTCQAHAIMWRSFGQQFASQVGVPVPNELTGQGQLQLAFMLCRRHLLTRVENHDVSFQDVQWHLARMTLNSSLQDEFQHSGIQASILSLVRLCDTIWTSF
jgi:hypothetical protein